jgi:hypothetical protein
LTQIFLALAGLAVIFVILTPDTLAGMVPKADDNPIMRAVRPVLTLLTVAFTLFYVGAPRELLWVVLLLAAYMALSGLVLPLAFRGVGTYREKLHQDQLAEWSLHRRTNELLRLGTREYLLATAAIFLIAAAYGTGYGQGSRRMEHLVVNTTPEVVVLRVYGTRAVTAELLRNERKLRRVFRVMDISQQGVRFRLEPLGRLGVEGWR